MKRFLCALTCALLLLSFAPRLTSVSAADAGLENLWDFNLSYCGYYDANGEKYYSHLYQTSADIPAAPGVEFFAGPLLENQDVYIAAFDSAGRQIERVTDLSKLKKEASLEAGASVCSYVAPANCASVRFTCSATVFATFCITKNKAFSAGDFASYLKKNELEHYEELRVADKSAFAGKKLLWCGDSVGAGSYEHYYEGAANGGLTSKNKSTKTPSWAGRVSAILGIGEYKNTSHGGATYSTKYPSGIIPSQLATNASSKYDYIVIEGGTVDCGGYNSIVVPLGYITDSYNPKDFAPDNTFLGGVERSFYAATSKAPDAVIICVIPYSAPSNKNFNYGWERLYQYIPYVCEKWGIPCVNLYKSPEVNAYFDYDRSIGGLYYYDNLHCSPLGYTASSTEIAETLLNAPKYSASARHMPEKLPVMMTKEGYNEPDVKAGGTLDFNDNKFETKFITKGVPGSDCKTMEKTSQYVTSGFVKVKGGDTVVFGPCSPYEDCQIIGFDSSQKPVTGRLDSTYLTAVSILNSGYLIYSYTVPDNVKYVKASFLATMAPVITVNKPFDSAFYNEALRARNAGESIAEPYTDTPVTTAEVFTAAETTEEEPHDTACETTPEEVTPAVTPESTDSGTSGGCGSCSLAAVFCVALAAIPVFRKKE